MADRTGLTDEERAELEQLRAEKAARAPPPSAPSSSACAGRRPRTRP